MNLDRLVQFYGGIYNMGGLKVVDTSFLIQDFDNKAFGSDEERTYNIKEAIIYYQKVLPKILNGTVTFPEETIADYRTGLKKLSRAIKKNSVGKIARNSRGKNRDFLPNLFFEHKVITERLRKIKRRTVDDISRNPTEARISQRGIEYLQIIMASVAEVVSKYDSSKVISKQDQSIFAKCIAITYTEDVLLLTADSDFLRLQNNFYQHLQLYPYRPQFPIPEKKLEVVFRLPRENFKFEIQYSSGKREIIEFVSS